jgi:hypothetical protein
MAGAAPIVGYDDTPFIPNQRWRVHDVARPRPRRVTPGADDRQAPSDAIVLFDGTGLAGWVSARDGGAAGWQVADGYLEVVPGTGDIQSLAAFGDCQLHIEFCPPSQVIGDSQGRGNSGIFLMDRYEIQVLDGYDNPTYADGSTGAIYGQYPPLVNACREPGVWQTYDILWVAPRFDGERVISPPRCSLLHNGVLVHLQRDLIGPTAHKVVTPLTPHAATGPLRLQDHRNPVRFRNIWYRAIAGWDAVES